MLFNFDDGHGAQALDQNQLARRLQFSVATGCAVSPGTNDLTVQVSAGGVIFDGASVSVSAQDNVALASPDSADPRKDVVYVDGTGDVKVATGTPEPAQPPGQIRRDTFRPAPPDLAAMNAVVLAEVWVSAQASDIVADDISDRRLFADAAFRNVKSESVSTDSATSTGLSASLAPPSSENLIAQKTPFSWTAIDWEDKGGAIIDGSANPDNAQAGYVGVIPGSVFGNPLDNWYFFWSGDNPSDILLSTAPTLWPSKSDVTYQGVLIERDNLSVTASHLASPWPVLDPKNDRINLYYHRGAGGLPGQVTDLATIPLSGDGTNASRDQLVIKSQLNGRFDAQERSYLAVERTANGYVGVYNGRDQDDFLNAPGIAVARSVDGREWTVEPTPAFDGMQFGSFDPQKNNGGIPGLFRLGGELHVTYYDVDAGEARVLPFSQRHTATFAEGETVMGLPSWDTTGGSGTPVINEVVAYGGYLYLLYHLHDGGGASEIGVKRANLGDLA